MRNHRVTIVKLVILSLAALLVRAVLISNTSPDIVRNGGGDDFWYLAYGAGMFLGEPTGVALGFPVAPGNVPTAPLYLIFVGAFQQFTDFDTAVILIWVTQGLLHLLIGFLAYDLTVLLSNDDRAGLLAAAALVLSLSLVLETVKILTETLYISFIMLGIWSYCRLMVSRGLKVEWWQPVLVGITFGLATLTRAVSILFPIGIMLHLMLVLGLKSWRRAGALAIILLISYSVTISTWTIYNWVQYDRFVIVSDQFTPALWRGAVDEDGSPRENDELLGEETPLEQASAIISSDPRAYLMRRAVELGSAYLQPHGTVGLGGESLKQLASDWINSGFSIEGLRSLLQGDQFVPKLLIYIWHYLALIGGVIGMWLTRSRWQISLVLIGFIAYTSVLHFVVLALPRYIYPTFPLFWIFASVAYVHMWDLMRGKPVGTADETIPTAKDQGAGGY